MKEIIRYITYDGNEFNDRAEAAAHEAAIRFAASYRDERIANLPGLSAPALIDWIRDHEEAVRRLLDPT